MTESVWDSSTDTNAATVFNLTLALAFASALTIVTIKGVIIATFSTESSAPSASFTTPPSCQCSSRGSATAALVAQPFLLREVSSVGHLAVNGRKSPADVGRLRAATWAEESLRMKMQWAVASRNADCPLESFGL